MRNLRIAGASVIAATCATFAACQDPAADADAPALSSTPPSYGASVWPKFHQNNSLTGRSSIDTSSSSGRVRWKAFVGPPAPCRIDSATGFNRCGTYVTSPVLGGDGTVYQLGGDGKLRAFDRADGSLKWATMTAPPSIAPQESTPMVASDRSIYLASGAGQSSAARFWHLDMNGNVLWSSTCSGGNCPGFSSSPSLRPGDDVWMANADEQSVEALDSTDHVVERIAVHAAVSTMSVAIAGDGTGYWASNGTLYVTAGAALQAAFNAVPSSVDSRYSTRLSAPALTDDGLVIYSYQFPNGGGSYTTRVVAFRADQVGRGPYWQLDLPRSKPVYGLPSGPNLSATEEADAHAWRSGITSPAIGPNGLIYVGGVDGLYAVRNAQTGAVQHGRVVWSVSTAQVASSPAVGADGRVYFGAMDGFLYCVDGNSGSAIWKVKTAGQVNSSPAIGADGAVFVTSDDGYLYAVR
jgi:outer membrane protein assembly factor BamB